MDRALVTARRLCDQGTARSGRAKSTGALRQFRPAGAGRGETFPARGFVSLHGTILRALPGRQPREVRDLLAAARRTWDSALCNPLRDKAWVAFAVVLFCAALGAQALAPGLGEGDKRDSGWRSYGRDPGGSRFSPLARIFRATTSAVSPRRGSTTTASRCRTPAARTRLRIDTARRWRTPLLHLAARARHRPRSRNRRRTVDLRSRGSLAPGGSPRIGDSLTGKGGAIVASSSALLTDASSRSIRSLESRSRSSGRRVRFRSRPIPESCSLRARDLQGPRHRRVGCAGVPGARTGGRRAGVRRADRPPGLGVPHRAARERAGQRDLGRRVVARAYRRQRVVDDGRRRGARPRVPPDRLGVGTSFYGGDRKGQNLYANCIVALDAATGRIRWHFQTVHHDLWDYDIPAQPVLVRSSMMAGVSTPWHKWRRPGSSICWIARPGDRYFPSRSARYGKRGAWRSGVADAALSGEAAAARPDRAADARRAVERHSGGQTLLRGAVRSRGERGIFTPHGEKLTLVFPGNLGGATWSGAAFDPSSGFLFVNTNELGAVGEMRKQASGAYRRASDLPGAIRAVLG